MIKYVEDPRDQIGKKNFRDILVIFLRPFYLEECAIEFDKYS